MSAREGAREDDAAAGADRGAIVADLTGCRDDLHRLLATATPGRLGARTTGTRWSNEQLLFHMVFGFLVVRRLLPLVRLMAVLPPWVGRGFARLLDAGRVPFHWVNYAGSCGGALVFNHARMGRLCDHTINHLVASLEREPERRLGRGMPFPTSWDPYFQPFMTLAEVYAYPGLHYRHHRAQLTLRAR
ncbi:DinB family protein [Pedococcus sp. P5_B7]